MRSRNCLDSGRKKAKIIQKSIAACARTPNMGRSALTLRAIMSSAAGDDHPANGRLAAAAGLGSPLVNTVFKLKKTTLSVGADVVGDRRTTQKDGVGEDFAQRQPEPFKLNKRQAVGPSPRANAGIKEAFIGIDIADACKQGLVEQSCLDRQAPAAKK